MALHDVAYPGLLEPLIADVGEGVWLHLVEPNGSGKSTLLAIMAGLLDGSGRITFAGRLLTSWSGESLARQRAWLSQHHVPPFSMPVWHYLSLHQQNARDSNGMMQVAETFQLTDKLPRLVNQLSGGEWQRVRLAAVILQIHPDASPCGKMLLLDEPMNSLDVAQQATLNNVLRELYMARNTVSLWWNEPTGCGLFGLCADEVSR